MAKKRVKKDIGWGEGGAKVPDLYGLLTAIANDIQALYGDSDLDKRDRELIGVDETALEVAETVPAEGAEEVVISADIVVTFDRNIEFSDNEASFNSAMTLHNVTDDTEHTSFNTTTISDAILTIDLDSPLTADKEYKLTIPAEGDVVNGVADGSVLEQDFELTFTTAE